MSDQFTIRWHDRGRPPQVKPDSAYPAGKDVDLRKDGQKGCFVELPYPTGQKNIGTWIVECRTCGARAGITAASRPDDPRSAVIPCRPD